MFSSIQFGYALFKLTETPQRALGGMHGGGGFGGGGGCGGDGGKGGSVPPSHKNSHPAEVK